MKKVLGFYDVEYLGCDFVGYDISLSWILRQQVPLKYG